METAILASLALGLVMRCFRWARTLPAVAAFGVVSIAVIYRERALGVYAFSLAAFLYVRLAARLTRGREISARWWLATIGQTALAATFLVQSTTVRYGLIPSDSAVGAVMFLDMILLLRLVLFVWEFGVGRFDQPSVQEYLAWCWLPFCCMGPFLRFSDFERQRWWKREFLPPLGREWWTDAAVQVAMLAAAAAAWGAQPLLQEAGRAGKVLILYGTAPWGWYLMAAGASGLLRLAGALGGVTVPVNFNSPFRSTNISEFWSRWNMTATSAFRDMLFFNRWGLAHPNVYLNTVILFLLVGLWHAANAYWLLWGLMHGAGFCVFILWRKWRGPGARPLPRVVGWGLTYVFVCSCWVGPSQILKLANQLAGN